MLLWRLSGRQHAEAFDGGFGMLFDGRWNNVGHPITYCATSPALCLLEKLVHIEDPALLPELVMITYEGPDTLEVETIALETLPTGWRRQEGWTQQRGDAWHRACSTPLLRMPSVIIPLAGSPDLNILINHHHPRAGEIRLRSVTPFGLDPRLF